MWKTEESKTKFWNIIQKYLSQVLDRDDWQQVAGKGGIFSSVGIAAGEFVAAANAQPADTSLSKLASLTAVLHHGLQGVKLW